MKKEHVVSYSANWGCVAVSIIVFLVTLLAVMYCPDLKVYDTQLLNSIKDLMSPYSKDIPLFISVFGYSNTLLWPQITVSAVLLSHKKYFKTFLFLFVMQSASFLLQFLKTFVHRERPCVYEGFSFPSAHSVFSMCLYGIIAYLVLCYVKNRFWRYFCVTLCVILVILTGYSRLWLGVHYPSDVIAGYALGFLFVSIYIILAKFINKE